MSALGTLSVVFDLDGTLVDSEPNYYEAGRRTLAEYGVPDFSWAEHERYVGISTRETVADWRLRHGLSASVDELVAVKNRHYLELARTKTTVFPRCVRSWSGWRTRASGWPWRRDPRPRRST